MAIFCTQDKSSESFSKQPTQLIVELNSSLWQIIDSQSIYVPLVKQLSIHIVLHILTENFELSYWSICEFSEIQYQSSQRYMWLQNVGIDFCFWGLHVSLLDPHDWWFCSEKILSTFYNFDRNILQHLITHLDDIFSDD